jgi:hypothetical protein
VVGQSIGPNKQKGHVVGVSGIVAMAPLPPPAAQPGRRSHDFWVLKSASTYGSKRKDHYFRDLQFLEI